MQSAEVPVKGPDLHGTRHPGEAGEHRQEGGLIRADLHARDVAERLGPFGEPTHHRVGRFGVGQDVVVEAVIEEERSGAHCW